MKRLQDHISGLPQTNNHYNIQIQFFLKNDLKSDICFCR